MSFTMIDPLREGWREGGEREEEAAQLTPGRKMRLRAESDLIASRPPLEVLVLAHFLSINRDPLDRRMS
jgi:hypothetical protein